MSTANTQKTQTISIESRFHGVPRQVLQLSPVRDIFIGDASGCDLFAPLSERSPLIVVKEGAAFFCFTDKMSGEAKISKKQASLTSLIEAKSALPMREAAGLYALAVQDGASYELSFEGGYSLFIKATDGVQKPGRKSKLDRAILGYTGASVAAHALIMSLIFSVSPEANSLELSQFESGSQVTKFTLAAFEEKKEETKSQLSDAMKKSAEVVSEKKKSSHIGVTTPRTNGHGTSVNRTDSSKVMTPEGVQLIAQNVGINALLAGNGRQGVPLSGLMNGDENLFGDELGERPGEDQGSPFGTPYGEGNISTGEKLADVGNDDVKKDDNDWRKGPCTFCDTKKTEKKIEFQPPTIDGVIEKDTIRRVVRGASNGIKFCYEQGLQSNPSLEGKVKIHFVINTNGSVAAANVEQGIDAKVDSCIAGKIMQLSFPAAGVTKLTEVSYPFMFRPAGQ